MVKVDRLGRVSKRNRRFFSPIVPFNSAFRTERVPVKDILYNARDSSTRSSVTPSTSSHYNDAGPVPVQVSGDPLQAS